MKKTTAFVMTASLATSALIGFSPAVSAHAMTKTAVEQSVPQGPKTALNNIYEWHIKDKCRIMQKVLKLEFKQRWMSIIN
nr:hypothetical protein [Bacillus pumilus]